MEPEQLIELDNANHSGSNFLGVNCTNSTNDDPLSCSEEALIYDLYEPSLGIVILLSLCYGLISAGAVIGNSLVIYMVVRSRRMRTITNFFIANLALSDVVIGMFSIPFQFQAALLQRWHLPAIMCNLCPFFQNVSVNTSIITLIAIALDRYNAILYPFSKKSSKRETKIRIGLIWVVSVLLAIPQIIAFRVEMVDFNIPQCIPSNMSLEAFKWYTFALCFAQYFLPLGLLCFAYVRIAFALWGRRAPGEADDRRDANILRNKKKAIKVLMSVVILFGVCWLPLQTYYVTSVVFEEINSFKYINIVWFFSHWLAMSNSCVNPFIYFFCHDKFKKEFQDHFKSCFKHLSRKRERKDVNGRVTYRGRNYYLTHSVSSDEEKQDVMRHRNSDTSFSVATSKTNLATNRRFVTHVHVNPRNNTLTPFVRSQGSRGSVHFSKEGVTLTTFSERNGNTNPLGHRCGGRLLRRNSSKV